MFPSRLGNTRPVPPASHPTVPEHMSEGHGHHHLVYRVTAAVLALILSLALVDGIGGVRIFGVDSRTWTAEGDGYRLEVTAGSITRPGMATPLEIRVEHGKGFDGPVEVALPRSYTALFDYQRMYPEPTAERTRGDYTVLEFDPPDTEELVVSFDWKLEPAVQLGRPATFAVVEEGAFVAQVDTYLWVWP